MLTAEGLTPVEVLAALISRRERRTVRRVWRGRVTPMGGESLLGFLRAENVQLHVAGQPNPCIVTTLGEANSEVEGLGQPTF
jgi:hypothetical protein